MGERSADATDRLPDRVSGECSITPYVFAPESDAERAARKA